MQRERPVTSDSGGDDKPQAITARDLEELVVLPEALSPTRMQRLANKAVNNLGLSLVDVTVEPRENGQVAIVLPDAWAYLFLAHLDATARQVQEQLRKAMYAARIKDARLQAELAEAAKKYEATVTRIQGRYRELVAKGLSQRDCIRRIKAENHDALSATEIQSMVTAADPRKKRATQRAREKRNARILALRAEGMKPKQIAAAVGEPKYIVMDVLRRKGGKRDAQGSDRLANQDAATPE